MTEKEFNDWIDTEDGQSAFYEFLYHHYNMGDEACIRALESGDYIESFMEHLEVEIDKNQIKLEELEKKKKRILSSCAHWMSCNDGSYEMALNGCGYYKIVDEIKQLKTIIQA